MTIPTASQLDSSTIRQLQQLQQLLIRQTGSENAGASSSSAAQDSVKFNKKVLDYDYGDEEEDDNNDNRNVTPRNPNPLLSEVYHRITNLDFSFLIPVDLRFVEQQHCPAAKRSKCVAAVAKFTKIEATRRKTIKTNRNAAAGGSFWKALGNCFEGTIHGRDLTFVFQQ